jgi:hypothetical protein
LLADPQQALAEAHDLLQSVDMGPKALKEGEVALVLCLLERRCGVLAPEVKERIAGLSLVQMEALAEALLEFTGPADLEQWVRHM